ncbi:MAG: DNA primase [Euryarchaeota archaeon]|nr:DNA primase [Euryarchaeota archaeon]
MTTWSSDDRLKLLSEILDELANRESDQVILVEGKRDQSGLKLLGVEGEMIQVQTRDGIFRVAEQLAREKKRAIILTDWDRKGGHLCRLLRDALAANEVPYDDKIRGRMARVSRGEIKDVESLPSYFSRLVSNARIVDGSGFNAR